MDLALPVKNLALGLWHAQRLNSFNAINPATHFDGVVSSELPDGFSSGFIHAATAFPAVWWGGSRAHKVIYLDGCRSALQANAFMNGYDNGYGPTNTMGRQDYLRDAVQQLNARLAQGHFGTPEYVTLVGYSLGGSVAVRWAFDLHQARSPWKLKVFTYGAPRSLNSDHIRVLDRTPIIRYMNSDDPVPLIPPRPNDVPALAILNPLLTNLRWCTFYHVQGGAALFPNGNIADVALPPDAFLNPTTSLASWLAGFTQTQNGPHTLHSYISRLTIRVEKEARPEQVAVEAAPQENPEQIRRGEETRRQQQVIQNLHRQGAAQNAPNLVIPPNRRIRVKRIGGMWQVIWNDKVISISARKKAALKTAREGNEFLRQIQRQAIVHDGNLIAEFTAHIQQAVLPDGGFGPVMQNDVNL